MMAPSQNPLLHRFQALGPFTESEAAMLISLGARRRRVPAHQTIFREHDQKYEAYVVQSGWTCIYKMLPDGGRQVLNFPLPGDIVGLHNVSLAGSQFSFETLTDADVSPVPLTMIEQASVFPNVAQAIRWSAARDAAIIAEHLVNLGRRSALVRTAHLILETAARLEQIGVETAEGFDCPLSQSWIADALGLTAIHLNRVLRELREAELVTVRVGHVSVHDYDRLAELAVFEADYLEPPHRGPRSNH